MSVAPQESKETGYNLPVEYYNIYLQFVHTVYYLMLFSSMCDVLQGPEGPVGTRGLRGLQVSNMSVVK